MVGFTFYATVHLLVKALTTLTSLKSHSSTKRIHASFPYGCSVQFDARTSRRIAWDFAQLSTLVKLSLTCSIKEWQLRYSIITIGQRKGFPLIDHTILLSKLHSCNLHPCLVRWIAAFLQGRSQSVRIGSDSSNIRSLNGGIPKGTKLGPVLFSVMVNDLVST